MPLYLMWGNDRRVQYIKPGIQTSGAGVTARDRNELRGTAAAAGREVACAEGRSPSYDTHETRGCHAFGSDAHRPDGSQQVALFRWRPGTENQ